MRHNRNFGSAGSRISDCSSVADDQLGNFFSFDCTKQDILSKLQEFEKEWYDIPLMPPSVSVSQAKKDFRRQKVLLNGVSFTPELNSTNNNNLFASALKNLCEIVTRLCPIEHSKPAEIAESILQRSCRSGTGADSFFAVHQLFSIQDTLVTQHEQEDQPTIDVSLFVSNGSIWSRCDCKNSYSLVDMALLGEESGEGSINGLPMPWLYVDTYIRDDTNFSTGYHNRTLTIIASKEQIIKSGGLYPQLPKAEHVDGTCSTESTVPGAFVRTDTGESALESDNNSSKRDGYEDTSRKKKDHGLRREQRREKSTKETEV